MAAEIALLRRMRWLGVLLLAGLLWAGAAATAHAADDVDGVGLVDPSEGVWWLRDSGSGETTSFYFGNPGDLPFMGDWDCDGVDTPGLYRQFDGYVYLRNTNTQGVADVSFFFGDPGDVPLAGDFDGDGCDTVSIYRPSEGRFYVIDRLGEGDGGLGAAEVSYRFGDVRDVPFVGDFDGDTIDTFGVYRRGGGVVHLRNRHSAGAAEVTFSYGERGDTPIAGSWSGDADTVALWRALDGVFHVRHENGSGAADEQIEYGYRMHVPVAGRFGTLPGGDEPPPGEPPYPDVGSGRRIIYSNSLQQVWLIDENEEVVKTHLVSGRQGIPGPGTYSVYSKSLQAYAPYGGITMTHMVRFARGVRWPYGFHSIPIYSDGRPLQTEDQLGTFRSGGCVRQKNEDAVFVFNWAGIGTTVHVTP
jgi:hypothetical protein